MAVAHHQLDACCLRRCQVATCLLRLQQHSSEDLSFDDARRGDDLASIQVVPTSGPMVVHGGGDGDIVRQSAEEAVTEEVTADAERDITVV